MPVERRAQRLLDMLAATGGAAAAEPSPSDRRAALRTLAQMADDASEVVGAIEQVVMPGPGGQLTLRIYSPYGASSELLPGLVFFHGGGWVAGGLDTHDGLCRRLANAAGARVGAVDYRLAPEHPFPAAFEDALAATHWVAEQAARLGIDPARLIVGGDSAGGGLAAAVCQALRGAGPPIALQMLICPILDIADESASRRDFADGFFLTRAAMAADLRDYLPTDADASDPRLSPLQAQDLTALPPALIHTAEYDPFRDEGAAYAERLRSAGVAVEAHRHEGMIHYFYALARAIPYARTAAEQIGAQVRAKL